MLVPNSNFFCQVTITKTTNTHSSHIILDMLLSNIKQDFHFNVQGPMVALLTKILTALEYCLTPC